MWVNEIPNLKFINVPKLGCIAINLKSQIATPVFTRLQLSRSPYLPLYRRPQTIASNSIVGVALTRGPLVAPHLQHTSSPPVASLHLSYDEFPVVMYFGIINRRHCKIATNYSTFHLLEAQSHQQHSQGEDQTVDHESTITLWLNNKFLKNKKRTCDIKRMSRLKMQEPHVTGTKYFARLAEEDATKNDDVYPSRGEIFRIAHTRKDGSIVNENVATILADYLFQQHGEKTDGTPKVPPSPIPTGNYNVSPEQLASMTRDHDMSALQNFDGVKGLSEMLKTNPDKGIDDDESNILDRKNVFGSNTYPRKKGRSFWGIKEGWYAGGSIALAVIIVIVVTEKQNIHLEVVRGGRRIEISIFDIVVGDVIPLKIGDQVPADGVLISGHSLSIDESSITGETKIVHKDHKNPFLMSGCKVADGYGTMLATSVRIRTEWGLLMASISEDNDEETPLQILLTRFFTGYTEDDEGRIEFIAGKTGVGDAVDGAIKIFTVAVCIYYLLST
ncbi:hypothetical protein LXL04_034662 [Taraxacum kok-saghyz]